MAIKNIVISGGGPAGLISYGAIKKLNQLGFWNRNILTAIYASSIGGFIGFLVAMDFEWQIIDDYIIERPWIKAFETLTTDILEIICNTGIDGEEIFSICTKPILAAKELPHNITLKQLYDITKIDLCLTTTELNCSIGFGAELISYRTYPDMTLNCALACTCALPMIFKPIFYGEKCFIDGGVINNFPLKICIDDAKCNQNEIVAFTNKWNRSALKMTKTTSIIDYCHMIMSKLHWTVDTTKEQPTIQNLLFLEIEDIVNIATWYDVLDNKEKRKLLILRGETTADIFFTSMSRQEIAEDSPPEA